MHIIIAAITAIAGLIWALNALQRSGFDLNSLNPFFWMRRRQWEKKQVNPLYAIETPRDLAALLTFAVMRQAGDPTAEQKGHLLGLYKNQLRYDDKDANDLYRLVSHLLGTDPNYRHKVPELVKPASSQMTDEQKASIPKMVKEVATFAGTTNAEQDQFILDIDKAFLSERQ